MSKVHFERELTFLVDDKWEMALMVVEVRFEAGDGEIFGEFDDGHVHAEYMVWYASEGGTCFLKFICAGLGSLSDGYIK